MSKRWKYLGEPGTLVDDALTIDLETGQEFDAPDSFLPEPNPHPLFKPVTAAPAAKPAPATAPQE
jgi:hypothetical protein